MKRITILILSLLFLLHFSLIADTREKNIDVFILLDKSLSMEGNIEAVNEYINSSIVDKIIIPGDMLYIIQFYGKADVLIDTVVVDEDHKNDLKSRISGVNADGRFTDIGNALDRLARVIPEFESNERMKYMLLITDGKQEAPPESKYFSPDGSFNHEFLEHTRIIEKQGWKIHVLGIGRFTDAQAIAEELSGTYTEVDTEETDREEFKSQLAAQTEDFLSIIRIANNPGIIYRGFIRKPYLRIETEAENINSIKNISLSSINIENAAISGVNILKEPTEVIISENGRKEIFIPINEPPWALEDNTESLVRFNYAGNDMFTPSVFETKLAFRSFFYRYAYVIIIFSVILALLLLMLIKSLFSRDTGKAKEKVSFYCYLDGKKIQELPFVLGNMERLYMNITPSGIVNFTKQKLESTKAVIVSNRGILSMELWDKTLLKENKNIIYNILEKSFDFLRKNGKQFSIMFKRN